MWCILILIISLPSKADWLSDLWNSQPKIEETVEEEYEIDTYYDSSEPEHYSWDLKPINPFEDTVIIYEGCVCE